MTQTVSVPVTAPAPLTGIGYRAPIHGWIMDHGGCFGTLEVTLDHYLMASPARRVKMAALSDRFPLNGHGIGLSLGTDAPLDLAYLDRIAAAIDALGVRSYSEHVAFTKVPVPDDWTMPDNWATSGDADEFDADMAPWLDLANLLPVPKSDAVAEMMIRKIETVRAHIPVPFLLENITYYFDYPDSVLDDVNFFQLLFRETGAGMLLDLENLHINAINHGLDARTLIDALPEGLVREVHVAGGIDYSGGEWGEPACDTVLVDTHDRPLRSATLDLLAYLLDRQMPETIILERDGRLGADDLPELLDDLDRINGIVGHTPRVGKHVQPTPA